MGLLQNGILAKKPIRQQALVVQVARESYNISMFYFYIFRCADGTLYWSAIQTMPFARPQFRELLSAVDFVISKDYPARGEVP